MSNTEFVMVSRTEIEELRKLKEDLPKIIEQAKIEGGMDRLKALTQRNKENPEEHRRKSKERYELKRDQILAKRREAESPRSLSLRVYAHWRIQCSRSDSSFAGSTH